MARLKALSSLVLVTAGVLLGLRGLHLALPMLFPTTRQGPILIGALQDIQRQVGFAPLVPAYRPEVLGNQPERIAVWFSPDPACEVIWRTGEHDLVVRQRRGGPQPSVSPLAVPLEGIAESSWWVASGRSHLVLRHMGFWIEIETSLPARDLRRFADTLTPY